MPIKATVRVFTSIAETLTRLGRRSGCAPDLRKVMAIEGQISVEEARLLFKLATEVSEGSAIVEIGTYRGRSAAALAFGSLSGPKCPIYAVDPHVPFRGVFGGQFGPADQAALYANLTRAGIGHIVHVVCLPSILIAQGWPSRNVGLLWVDGDHSQDGVRSDFQAWRPHLIPGGIVAFHDTDAPGVASLLEDLNRDSDMVALGSRGRIAWFAQVSA